VAAVYQRLAMAILDPPADWPPVAEPGVSATPMLFVVGDRDAVTPAHRVRAMARRYPPVDDHPALHRRQDPEG
jgi:pimeloyl-ACP methyl ester carboxylesterase